MVHSVGQLMSGLVASLWVALHLASAAVGDRELSDLARPHDHEEMRWHEVSPAMSNPRCQGPECSRELKRESIASFFQPGGDSLRSPV